MKHIRDTPELLQWFYGREQEIRDTYTSKINSLLNHSPMIQNSITYHVVKEFALMDEYFLSECQIKKLIILVRK